MADSLLRRINAFCMSTWCHSRPRISPRFIPVCRAVSTMGFKCSSLTLISPCASSTDKNHNRLLDSLYSFTCLTRFSVSSSYLPFNGLMSQSYYSRKSRQKISISGRFCCISIQKKMYNLRLAQKYPTQVIILRVIIVAFHRKFCYRSSYNHHKVLALLSR